MRGAAKAAPHFGWAMPTGAFACSPPRQHRLEHPPEPVPYRRAIAGAERSEAGIERTIVAPVINAIARPARRSVYSPPNSPVSLFLALGRRLTRGRGSLS